MKKVLKNILKSIASVCLILEILSTIYLGIYNFAMSKAVDNNDKEVVDSLIEVGKNMREDIKSKSEEEGNKQIGSWVTIVPMYIRFSSTLIILMASIVIGGVIGVGLSMDEASKKKIIITYVLMYLIILTLVALYELLTYGSVNMENFPGMAIEIGVAYTIAYVITILVKRVINNNKVKIMNEELK